MLEESRYCCTLSAKKVQTSHKCKCLRRILRGYIDMQDRNQLMDYISILSFRRRGWDGLVIGKWRMRNASYTLDWKPQSTRELERPKITWRRSTGRTWVSSTQKKGWRSSHVQGKRIRLMWLNGKKKIRWLDDLFVEFFLFWIFLTANDISCVDETRGLLFSDTLTKKGTDLWKPLCKMSPLHNSKST